MEKVYTYSEATPYMSGYEYFATLDEALKKAGYMAFKYNNEELVYKVVAKTVAKHIEPVYETILL